MINPRLLAVHQILTFVRGKGVHSVTKLLECDAEALELIPEPGAAVTRAPIKKLSFPRQSIIGAVSNGSEVFLANGDTHIRAGERVIVLLSTKRRRPDAKDVCQQGLVLRPGHFPEREAREGPPGGQAGAGGPSSFVGDLR